MPWLGRAWGCLTWLVPQMDRAERGFSFTRDGPLDMRMGLTAGASAEHILNSWPEAELARVFRDYGEERHWRAYASRVVDARGKAAIRTTQQFCAALGTVGRARGKGSRVHPATRVFQVGWLTSTPSVCPLIMLVKIPKLSQWDEMARKGIGQILAELTHPQCCVLQTVVPGERSIIMVCFHIRKAYLSRLRRGFHLAGGADSCQ